MSSEHGRAQAYNQFGDPEEEIHWAIECCPVECISWVTREELQLLEHVTADTLYDCNYEMENAMLANSSSRPMVSTKDPFELAWEFKRTMDRKKEQKDEVVAGDVHGIEERIEKIFKSLGSELKSLGWPAYCNALPE